MIIFALNDPDSLYSVSTRWVPEIAHHAPKTPYVLVGNKVDLRENSEEIARLREKGRAMVTHREGEEKAREIGAAGYFETSALTASGIEEVFKLVTELLFMKDERPSSGKCSVM